MLECKIYDTHERHLEVLESVIQDSRYKNSLICEAKVHHSILFFFSRVSMSNFSFTCN